MQACGVETLSSSSFSTTSSEDSTENIKCKLHNGLAQSLQKLLVQTVYFVVVGVLMSMADFYGWTSIDLKSIVEMSSIFVLIWLFFGFSLLFLAQKQIKRWARLEHGIVGWQYKQVRYGSEDFQSLEEKWYALARTNFINPVHSAPVTEAFLRKDFRFDMYLAYCSSKTLSKLFQITLYILLLLITTFIIGNQPAVRAIESSFLEQSILIFVLCALTLCLLVFPLKNGVTRSLSQLIVSLDDDGTATKKDKVLAFNNTFDYGNIELNNEQGKLPTPPYLKAPHDAAPPNHDSSDPYYLQNKHEKVFCCGRRGINNLLL